MDRREFLKYSALLTAASSSHLMPLAWSAPRKRVLVLGGTLFLGPAIVEALCADGHSVTLFNRGVTNPGLFPHLEKLRGFRSADASDQDLSALTHRHFDVVVDVWPNDPEVVASAATLLKDRAQHYLYVSSVGAYDHALFGRPEPATEDGPLQPWDAPGRPYNRNKAESERRLHRIIGEPVTIVRPGPIQGHRDEKSDLLTWLLRAQDGGEHIAPGDGTDPVEFVDVKDVARFVSLSIEKSLFGTFNLTGRQISFRQLIEACKAATRSDSSFVWIPQAFLHENGLETDHALRVFGGNFPLWVPERDFQGIYRVSSEKAFRAGWVTRAFDETAFDCLSDFSAGEMTRSTLLSAEKEEEVITAWRQRSRTSGEGEL